ncbi:hypothetical protein VTK73DRAFT_8700 [Phialemonium thermophilum]|uniref:Single-stranded DNA-binding protein n=1 Tax=Phialemonium thermophilum TaxID=223376 RepID=A0ABR3W786_9PEZI
MSAFLRTATTTAGRPGCRAFSSSAARRLARITIVGRLADSPELVATSTGREILRYTLASNSGPSDNRQTSWFRVTSFVNEGPRRDFIQGLAKGSLVYVEGDVSINTYNDSEGNKKTSINITERALEALSRPHSSGSGEGSE